MRAEKILEGMRRLCRPDYAITDSYAPGLMLGGLLALRRGVVFLLASAFIIPD